MNIFSDSQLPPSSNNLTDYQLPQPELLRQDIYNTVFPEVSNFFLIAAGLSLAYLVISSFRGQ